MDLKPCPFCGSKKLRVIDHSFVDDEGPFQIECELCQAQGPKDLGQTKDQAAELWNTRKEK